MMRMKHAHDKSARRRRATNVSLRVDLVETARELDLNLSRELEGRLEDVIRQRKTAAWKKENRAAVDAYARFVERHGVWNEDERGW